MDWPAMRTAISAMDESSVKGRANTLQLYFEDFLEVIVRLAHMMALPTAEELTQTGLPHAGQFLDALKEAPDEEQQFKLSRTLESNDVVDMPIEWKVKQFVLWLLHTVRGGHGDPETELTKKEANKFKMGLVTKATRQIGLDFQLPALTSGGKDERRKDVLKVQEIPRSAPFLPPIS